MTAIRAIAIVCALLAAAPACAENPADLITAIYEQAAAGNGDSGGDFLIEPQDRAPCRNPFASCGMRPMPARNPAMPGRSISIR
jgi:hypothetical protein